MKAKGSFANKIASTAMTIVFAFVVEVSAVLASNPNQRCEDTALGAAFGCNGILDRGGVIDLSSVVTLVFRVMLFGAVLWSVFFIVKAGFDITAAKDDADKRKKGITAILNAVIGLVVALLSFAIVTTVSMQVAGGTQNIGGSPCTATTSDGVTFTGFLERGSATKCVLERPGSTPLQGCTNGKDFNSGCN